MCLTSAGGRYASACLRDPRANSRGAAVCDLTGGAALFGCGGSATTTVTAPTAAAARCQPSFDRAPQSFGPEGGTGSIAVTVARECPWSASSGVVWLAITSGAQGQGDGTIAFKAEPNPAPLSRSGAVLIGDGRVEVAQQPAPCRFDVSHPDLTIVPAGAAIEIQVRTQAACEWSSSSPVPWATTAPASGRGSASVILTVEANNSVGRVAVIEVAGERMSLTQAAVQGPTPQPRITSALATRTVALARADSGAPCSHRLPRPLQRCSSRGPSLGSRAGATTFASLFRKRWSRPTAIRNSRGDRAHTSRTATRST